MLLRHKHWREMCVSAWCLPPVDAVVGIGRSISNRVLFPFWERKFSRPSFRALPPKIGSCTKQNLKKKL